MEHEQKEEMGTGVRASAVTVKEYMLGGLVLIGAFAAGYFWRCTGAFSGGQEGYFLIYGEAFSLFLFSVLFALFVIVSSRRSVRIAICALSSVLLFVSYPFHGEYLLGIMAATLLFWWGSWGMRREAERQVELHWHSILKSGVKKFFMGVALAFSVLYFSLLAPGATIRETLIPRPFFNVLLPALNVPLQTLIPGFSADATVDEVIYSVVQEQLKGQITLAVLSKARIQELIAEQRKEINKQFGLKLTGKEKVSEILYNVLTDRIELYSTPYKRYVPAVLSIGFFITIQFIFIFFAWLLYALFPLVIAGLRHFGFLERLSIMVEKEVVAL